MALLFDGIQNLTGKNLPNVKIEDITMSIGADPVPESNPHIQSDREVVYTGTSDNKQVQQSDYASTLADKQMSNKNFFLDVTLSILNVESLAKSLILNQINFLDFVYVKVIQSLSKNLTNELIQKGFDVDVSSLKNAADYSEKILRVTDFTDNRIFDFDSGNNKVYKHLKQVRFTSKNPDKDYLDVFAFSYIDMQGLINQFELNLTSDFRVKGYVSKENVISDKKVNSEAYILTDQNNDVFVGSVTKATSGKFVVKQTNSPLTSQPLNVVPVTNMKIKDQRNLIELNADIKINIQKPLTTAINTQSFIRSNSYLSELFISREKSGIFSSLFMFDMMSYLKDNSSTPEVYSDENISKYVRIKRLNILRKRVKTIDSSVYSFNDYTADKNIISTSETSFKNIVNKFSFIDSYGKMYTTSIDDLNNGNFGSTLPSFATVDNLKKIASVSEISLPNATSYRTFTFSDYEIASLTTGEYQYYIELDIEDQTNILIQKKIDKLNLERNKLVSYLADAERVDMFSVLENKQNDKFIQLQKSKYKTLNLSSAVKVGTINQFITLQDAPWISTPAALVAIEKENVNQDIDHTEKIKIYYKQLNPSTTNPTNIINVIEKIDSLIYQIRNKYSLDEKQDKNTVSSSGGIIKATTITHTFNNVFDSEMSKVGIDYVDAPESSIKDFKTGLPTITKSLFDSRINKEISKYFPLTSNVDLSSLNGSLTKDEQTSLGDITSYSTCYLSPSSAVLDTNETVVLSNTDSSNLNLPNYDKVVNKTVSSNSSKDKSVSNELSTKTSLSVSTINNFVNKSATIQLSFIKDKSLLPDASNIFNNNGFNTTDKTFSLQEICDLSNFDKTNDETLTDLTPLTNLFLDNIIRPSSANDTVESVQSISTIDQFNIVSSTSILSKIKTNVQSYDPVTKEDILTGIPIQTKSLMVDTVSKTKFNLSSFDFDPFIHPSTKNFMRLNFQTISQIEYLAGFEGNDLKNPTWKLLTKKDYDSLTGQIVIRIKQYSNKLFNIGTETGLNFNVYNEFLILDKGSVQPVQQTQRLVSVVPNISIKVNNNIITTSNILNNITLKTDSSLETEITKQLIVVNTVDSEIKPSYTFSRLELDNVNK